MAGVVAQINGNPILINALFRSNTSRSSSPLSLPPLSRRKVKVKVTVSRKQSYLASINEDVKAHLKHAMPVREPLPVYEPMHYLTFAAPWTTAPALCVAACELVGGHRNLALPAASALHLVYAASYTHENLHLQESCRPKSTIHHEYGPNIELLTGESIVPFGLEMLAKSDDPAQNISDRILRVIIEITRSIGPQGMIHGQHREIEYFQSNGNGPCHVEEIERVCEKYEGSLYSCAATSGAIMGGGNEEEIEKMRRYGFYVGKIQGMTNRIKGNDKDLMKLVEETRGLAIKELKGFDEAKVEAFSSFLFG